MPNSERGENIGITTAFENASENNNVSHTSIVNDETRNNIPDEVSDLSVPGTRFDVGYCRAQWFVYDMRLRIKLWHL